MEEAVASSRRVLFVAVNYAPELGGTSPYTTDAAEFLAAEGCEVSVITGFPHYPSWKVMQPYAKFKPRRERRNGVKIIRTRHYIPNKQSLLGRFRYELSFAVRAMPQIARNARQHDILVAVVPSLLGALSTYLAASLLRKPFAVWIQDSMHRAASQSGVSGQRPITALLAGLEKLIFNRAEVLVVISSAFRQQLINAGAERGRITIVRNWSFLPACNAEVSETRSHLGWSERDWVALHAGNMGLKQGLESIVEAARFAQEHEHQTKFVLLGGGSQLKKLQKIGADLRNLEFRENLDDHEYVNTLAAADVLLVCERRGVLDMSLPSKLTAYTRVGKPVVAFVSPGSATAREVADAGCGLIVNNERAPAFLARTVEDLRKDPKAMQRFSNSGREYAISTYQREPNLRLLRNTLLRPEGRRGR